MEIDYKNYYNNYNTTFYANLENGIVLNTHGNIPHCKVKSENGDISYLKNWWRGNNKR